MREDTVRRRIQQLLLNERSYPRHPVFETARATARYLQKQGNVTVDDAFAIAVIGVDVCLSNGKERVLEDAIELLGTIAGALDRYDIDKIPTAEHDAVVAMLFVEKLVDGGDPHTDHHLAAFLCGNQIDDALLRAQGRYPFRTALLQLVRNGLTPFSGRLAHNDLVARFKWALHLVATNDDVLTLRATGELRELLRDIGSRIDAKDSSGPRLVEAAGLTISERRRSLPRLRAQVAFELGRTLARAGLSSTRRALEESVAHFETACAAYLAVDDAVLAAEASVASATCMNWLSDHQESATARDHEQRVVKHGLGAHRLVLGLKLPEEAKIDAAIRARASYFGAEARLRVRIATSQEEGDKALKENYRQVALSLAMLKDKAAKSPWTAMACGVPAVEYIAELFEVYLGRVPSRDEEAERERSLATQRHYLTREVVDAFAQAISGALQSPQRRNLTPPRPGMAPDVWTPDSSPRALWRAIHRSLAALLYALSIQHEAAPRNHWRVIEQAFDTVRPLALPAGLLLLLRQREGTAVALALASAAMREDIVSYVERRIAQLEKTLANPALSAAERLLLSGWASALAQHARMATGDLKDCSPSRVLAMIDRSGAAAFRSDSLLFRRSAAAVFGPLSVSRTGISFNDRPHQLHEQAWDTVHLARDLLDFWARPKMVREASVLKPHIAATFKQALESPPTTTFLYPNNADTPGILRILGALPDEWAVDASGLVKVQLSPRSLDQIDSHLDPVRDHFATALQGLAQLGHLRPSDFITCPPPDVNAVERWLAARPDTALIAPGFWPEEVAAVNVFTYREGRLARDLIDGGTTEDGAKRLVMTLRFLDALADDRGSSAGTTNLEDSLVRLRETFRPLTTAMCERLRALGVRKIAFLLRGPHWPLLPWEAFFADDSGAVLGDRFLTAWMYTTADLPRDATVSNARDGGTLQIHGSGSSAADTAPGASVMGALATAGVATASLSGDDAIQGRRLFDSVAAAHRLRFFVHGHHDQLNPDADRLTLVDASTTAERVNLYPRDLRRLPVRGVDCVELWACEGAAHGRALQEHGVSDDPEDLTAAFLLAGARRVLASRWHVPAFVSALILERFALLVHSGLSDVNALWKARADYRAAFVRGGVACESFRGSLLRDLRPILGHAPLPLDQRNDIVRRAFSDAIQALRSAWYSEFDKPLSSPIETSFVDGTLGSWHPPRAQVLAAMPVADSIDLLVDAELAPMRAIAAWAGWRVTVGTLVDLS